MLVQTFIYLKEGKRKARKISSVLLFFIVENGLEKRFIVQDQTGKWAQLSTHVTSVISCLFSPRSHENIKKGLRESLVPKALALNAP